MLRTKPLSLVELLRLQSLPCQPRVLALLSNELRKPVPNMRSVAQLFSMDPLLAARLLESANGLASGWVEQPRSVPQALMVLTPEQLRQVLERAAPAAVSRMVPGWSLTAWSQYCQDVARISRALAVSVQANASAAYALGLLHGLGELLIHTADPQSASRIAELINPLHPGRALVETKLIGYNSATVAASLARQWRLPEAMCASFQYMHAPLQEPVFDPLTGVLHLAMWRASTQALKWDERQLAVTFPAELALALGMDIDMVLRQASIDWHAGRSLDVQV